MRGQKVDILVSLEFVPLTAPLTLGLIGYGVLVLFDPFHSLIGCKHKQCVNWTIMHAVFLFLLSLMLVSPFFKNNLP